MAKFKIGDQIQLKAAFPLVKKNGEPEIFHPQVTVLSITTEECYGGVQVWYGGRCWVIGYESQIIRFSEIELEEIPVEGEKTKSEASS